MSRQSGLRSRSRRTMPLLVWLVVLTCPSLLPAAAVAQTDEDQARAEALFERGVAAAREGAHGEAIDAFEESYRRFPHPGTLANLALYQEDEGRLVEAYRAVTELLERFGTIISEEARADARERRERLAGRLALVEVTTEPPGAMVELDHEPLGRTPLAAPLALAPGAYRVTAWREGFERAESAIDVAAGTRERVELTLAEALVEEPSTSGEAPSASEVAPPFSTAQPSNEEDDRRSFWRGPWPWVIGGLVVAAGLVAATSPLWDQQTEVDAEHRIR